MNRIPPQPLSDPAPPSLQATRDRVHIFRRRVIQIAVSAVLLTTALAATVMLNARSYQVFDQWMRHSYEVQGQILATSNALRRAESGVRAFLLTHDPNDLDDYFTQLPLARQHATELVRMTADNPAQNKRAQALLESVQARLGALRDIVQTDRRLGHKAALDRFTRQLAAQAGHPIEMHTRAMQQAEQALLSQREDHRQHSAMLTVGFTVAFLLAGVLLFAAAFSLAMREQARRLRSKERLYQAYLELAQSLEASRTMSDRMQRLRALSETLQSCHSMREAMQVIPSSLEDMLPASAGSILLHNASRNMVEKAAEWGQPRFQHEAVFPPEDCIALRRGQPYPPDDTDTRFHCGHLHPETCNDEPCQWLCIPLMAHGETLGLFHVQFPPGPEAPDRRGLAVTLGEQVGLLLGNLKLQESLRTQSIRDPLTGLFNRRYLEVSLNRELLRSKRHQRNLAVLMLDMDHFKAFNDTHGHDAGDALLQHFSRVLRETVRAEDIVCRYGGEEFTVLLPETEPDVARERAEQIREATAGMQFRLHGELTGGVTVSIGLAMMDPHHPDPEQLVQAADRALYRAKRTGRNRVEIDQPATGVP